MLIFNTKSIAEGISKETLFQTPSFVSSRISPDGEKIAYIGSDKKGISNVFILKKNQSEQITFFQTPEIIQFFWSGKSDKIILLKEEEGSGMPHLYGIDIHTKKEKLYSQEFPNAAAKILKIDPDKNCGVIGINSRNPKFHDLYLLDFDSGKWSLLYRNDSYGKFLLSDSLKVILKMEIHPDGSWTVFTEKGDVFLKLTSEEAFQTEFLSYDEEKRIVYFLDNRFSDMNRLIGKSLNEKKEEILGAPLESDVDEVLFIEGKPKAYASYFTFKKWYTIDPSIEKDLTFLKDQIGEEFSVVNQSRKGEFWIISMSLPDKGSEFWIYDRKGKKLTSLYSSNLQVASKMYPLVVKSRDGKKLVCYYTLPKELDKGGSLEAPIPLVVFPHGGPFKCRDKFEFNPYHQWLASCGYAVLSVNFRLSSGFGKSFVNAGNGEWGGKAHLDILDAAQACIHKGLTQKGKIGILGGSYGGYASLAALTFTPEFFNCSVSICGPSNLKTVLDNVPEFWEFTSKPLSDRMMFFTKKAFVTSMGGDPNQGEGTAYLEKCSPLNYLEEIKTPLLLIHGLNDHIVKENESRQIYEKMKSKDQKVTYLLFPDEGHRFGKFSNKMAYLDQAEKFLAEYLGGKYYPVTESLIKDSQVKIFR